jgi:DNA-binding protein WhiA
MSFSTDIKEEISILNEYDLSNYLAELSCFIIFICEKTDDTLVFNTYSKVVYMRFCYLIKLLYPKVVTKSIEEKKTKGTKYSIILLKVQNMINEFGLNEEDIETLELLTQTDECKKSFVRGAFLCIGTTNNPENGEYHLEFYHKNSTYLLFLQNIINYFDLSYKLSKRRNGFIVYTKNSTTIANTLLLIDAITCSYTFEDSRIKRDMALSLNRVINCQVVNEMRTIDISTTQIAQLNKIINTQIFDSLDKPSRDIITLRIKHPELSYIQLANKYSKIAGKKISKSYVFRRIHKVLQSIN